MVHEPISKIVAVFINDVQVPVIKQRRAFLGPDDAKKNINGYTNIPRSLIPANMLVNGQPTSPWRGGPRGIQSAIAPIAPTASLAIQPLQLSSRVKSGEVVDISDSDDEPDSPSPHTSSLSPSQTMPRPGMQVSLHSCSVIDNDGGATEPVSHTRATPVALATVTGGVKSDLKKFAAPFPRMPKAAPAAPSLAPAPAPIGREPIHASPVREASSAFTGGGVDFVSSASTISSIASVSSVSLDTASLFSPRNSPSKSIGSLPPPATFFYTRFSPIVPPGPSSERWLSENNWPPRFANVLRQVAEETSLGSWMEVLVERHNVDLEAAEAMVQCLIKDYESQSFLPSY